MNFDDTLEAVELVLEAKQVPLIIGETGIGKTSLVKALGNKKGWSVITIDGNLLKEGEIGGLPIVETLTTSSKEDKENRKTTTYALHSKLRQVEAAKAKGQEVLLFIDEINRCEHAVQQELMNLILNREINDYALPEGVHIVAAMNPKDHFEYQTVDMDKAQENRFVWLFMEADYLQWLAWADSVGIDEKIQAFIGTYPEYLVSHQEQELSATPRSYERIAEVYKLYKEKGNIHRSVFRQILRGNVGNLIAEELLHFLEADFEPLLSYEEVMGNTLTDEELQARVEKESHMRLYLGAKNILKEGELRLHRQEGEAQEFISKLLSFMSYYPLDLQVALLKEIRNHYPLIYAVGREDEAFLQRYFDLYESSR